MKIDGSAYTYIYTYIYIYIHIYIHIYTHDRNLLAMLVDL